MVLDTSVLVAAWRSRKGASYALLAHLRARDFEIAVSVPLVIEYEAVLLRHLQGGSLSPEDVEVFVGLKQAEQTFAKERVVIQ